MKLSHLALAAAAVLSVAGAARAAQITTADFTSPVITGFGNPTVTVDTFQDIPEPLSIANYTFTTTDAAGLRWFDSTNTFNDCVGGCVATHNSTDGLNVDLGGRFDMAGLYVGQAIPYALNVSFFDAGHNLLGTVVASGASDGVTFAGWQDSGGVAFISIQNPVDNNFFTVAQSGWLQGNVGVPEPATWTMMIAGFGLAGGLLRRRAALMAAA